MNNRPYLTNPARSSQARKAEPTGEQQLSENRIESRSNILASLVTVLAQSHYPNLRSDADSANKDLEALLVKEAKLRWLVRVAKYSEGANREALWREAGKLLLQLEHAAEAILHAKCA
jgi:hypothetical protein